MIWHVELHKLLRHRESRFQLDVSFSSDAPHLALFGPSGAGKTQTLKMIAGISTPDAGRVAIGGRVLFDDQQRIDLSPQQRQLGYVFQDYALFPHLTVKQNIAFGRRPGWLNPRRSSDDAAVERWLKAFGLQAQADHFPHQISGGQRQRTALARALVNDPAALLLDEPFAALDRSLRQKLRQELRDLQADIAVPTMLITHDEEDLEMLARETILLQQGTVARGKGEP
ncbi:sulfate/molybdate ABC transporter ATP-binding protein [Piscinibacter sp. HJYY11]|uniref:sulfate/molybdate ABC transporter ATP-binding protein n=1 Tax=Piscinibacter sp. HJYY11 TaxID=2801333 RepID=UPI00191D1FF7|nr:ATP-binding cassette domain-containing protein [Piscinibacter sp. HJYY11]MBL0730570.1 ATP-binding cassette domain-containing protein [Piscinibacter sp. HJYY11]